METIGVGHSGPLDCSSLIVYCHPPSGGETDMPTVLQVVHGYPPREVAGTELATARLVAALGELGWRAHVLASTRAPARRQNELLETDGEPGVTRLVNNLPFRSLSTRERDPAVELAVRRVVERVQPDVIHVQHLAFLSSGLRFSRPAVGTLHDHWPWCPAGGTMLRADRTHCTEPEPGVCLDCYGAFARLPGRGEQAAVGLAGALAGIVPPERLHAAWKRLPGRLRAGLRGPQVHAGSERDVVLRRRAVTAAWAALDLRMAPSAFLAREAERRGLAPVRVVPSGVDATASRRGGGPLVFLGSVLPHKGVDLVVDAYRQAWPAGDGPGLEIHGPTESDPGYARSLRWPLSGRLDPSGVPDLLSHAAGLVMASLWPENAPLVILEARAAGCPVVAPRIGGIPELLRDGRDGLLFPAGDTEALASCLRRLVGSQDRWRAVAAPPTMRQHAMAVETAYRQAMAEHRSPRATPPPPGDAP